MDEEAARADFARALAEQQPGFGTFFIARLLGLDIGYGEADCIVRFTPSDWMFNPRGTLHGGIIATVMDISMGHLLHHHGGAGATLEMKVQYLRAAQHGPITCRGTFLRRGRQVAFLESRMADAQDRPLAVATSTWQLVAPEGETP